MISDIVQSAVGKLLKVYGQTRPDISFEVCQMAGNLKSSDGLKYQKCQQIIFKYETKRMQINLSEIRK